MTRPTSPRCPPGAAVLGLSVLLAALVGGCGDPPSPDPASTGTGAPARTPAAPRPAAPPPATLPPVAKLAGDYLPPRPVRTPERIDPAVEECIERNVHDEKFESLGRRDARRKLRRLEVKADCEARVAAR